MLLLKHRLWRGATNISPFLHSIISTLVMVCPKHHSESQLRQRDLHLHLLWLDRDEVAPGEHEFVRGYFTLPFFCSHRTVAVFFVFILGDIIKCPINKYFA